MMMEFKDSNNIKIINNIPYYKNHGLTYKDKLKNGLSLDYVFQQEDNINNTLSNDAIVKTENDYNLNIKYNKYNHDDKYIKYDNEHNKIYKLKKDKDLPNAKKSKPKKFKKTIIKLNGFTYKQNDLICETRSRRNDDGYDYDLATLYDQDKYDYEINYDSEYSYGW